MPMYLFQVNYSTDAVKAMVANPQNRETAARNLLESLGGRVHSFHFCFGDHDVVCVVEAPDDVAMAAGSMLVGSAGTASKVKTTKLLSAQEAMTAMERAKRAASSYSRPT